MNYTKKSARFDELSRFLSRHWHPNGLASDSYGNEVRINSPLAMRFSIGGAIQKLFGANSTAAIHVAGALTTVADAILDSTVLCWEIVPERSLDEILWLVNAAKIADKKKLIPDLSTKRGNVTMTITYRNARRDLVASLTQERLAA